MKNFKTFANEGSYKFKDFDDPWKVMNDEDRREANRLFKMSMRAFPSSPRQQGFSKKLRIILDKYGLGKGKA
jgi:hypothetical protein